MMEKVTLKVSGMSCAACSARIEKALSPMKGVRNVDAVFSSNMVSIEFDSDVTSIDAIKIALSKAGYPVMEKDVPDNSWNLRSILISATFTIILAIYAMGPMFGLEVPFHDEPAIYATVQLALTIPVLILCRKFYTKGIKALLSGSPTMDTLVSLGSGTAFIYSLYITFDTIFLDGAGSGLCYDSSAMILTLISVGKFLEFRSRIKADDAVRNLLSMVPEKTNVIRGGEEVRVPIDELVVGDTIIIRPGERVSADGTVIEGRSSIDESMLTGESNPVLKETGSPTFTGTMNIDGTILIEVTETGGNTMIADIANMMEDAKATKAPIARMADKVAAYFVPTVITIAVASALLWFIFGRSVAFSLNIAISVLVISCPCALGLATPLAITVGSGRTAEHGILFRDAASLEMVGRADSVILDKTGTITYGEPTVTAFSGSTSVLSAVAAGESMSEHPIGKAIVRYCIDNGAEPKEISDFEYTVGKGISFTCEGHRYTVGSPDLYGGEHDDVDDTCAHVSMDGSYAGVFNLSDGIRPESKEVVSLLKDRGMTVHMVTGDNEQAAGSVAKHTGIQSVIASALPADKIMAVKKLQATGHDVIMVGDGINDSPALAQADVGIAMGSGSNIALSTSDVVLMNNDLYNIPRAVDFGRAVLRNIKQNLFLAFCYNALCIPIAAGLPYLFGMAEFTHMPMLAAAAMSLSSLSVVSNALRLRRYRPGY